MSDIAAATIVAKRTLPYARVLAESFRQHHPDIPFFVLLADEINGRFDPAREPFAMITLDELALDDRREMTFSYAQQELSYALTPFLLTHLLDRGFRHAAFFKQESLVTGNISNVLELMRGRSIVLTPHLLEPLSGPDRIEREQNILQSGVYNVGFLGVSDTSVGRDFLHWWSARTREHCLRDVAAGLHFEQRWLDLVPAYFDDYCYVRDPRFNVGHWNLPERDAEPTFVRFSGFDPERADRPTRYNTRLSMTHLGPAAALFSLYASLLKKAGYEEAKRWPYAYERYASGEKRGAWRELFATATRARKVWRVNYSQGGLKGALGAMASGVRRRLFTRPESD